MAADEPSSGDELDESGDEKAKPKVVDHGLIDHLKQTPEGEWLYGSKGDREGDREGKEYEHY